MSLLNNPDQIRQKILFLNKLYSNFFWTFHPTAKNLLKILDKELWETTKHNPIYFLQTIDKKQLEEKCNNQEILSLIEKIEQDYFTYLEAETTWVNSNYPAFQSKIIAYFSTEFGFHESFPIYSGGLGILAGDHFCTASDLGLNLIGVGLLYQQGYVEQQIDKLGNQISHFPIYDFKLFPVKQILDERNSPILVDIQLGKRKVYCNVWEVLVGRNKVILLDTNNKKNSKKDQQITAKLYVTDRATRIEQEVILGIGGIKALRKLKIYPDAWHLNEGHSAFMILELAQEYIINENISFSEVLIKVKKDILFTTHTPVIHGNEAFSNKLMKEYFNDYAKKLNIPLRDLLAEGLIPSLKKKNEFNMTVFALKNSWFSNGVSKLHQKVSQEMWQEIWPGKTINDVPINYVTNGVNVKAWIAPEIDQLFVKYIDPNWQEKIDNKDLWNKVSTIPNQELYTKHIEMKRKFVEFIKLNVDKLYTNNKVNKKIISKIYNNINEKNLILGFGRRIAPYKRALLMFKDPERLEKILNHPDYSVNIIIAGKSHPANVEGKTILKQIYKYSLDKRFLGRIILLENYNIDMARFMVTGSDVWLNTPERPLEASGTSGQKAAINGVLNFSILDGWWEEGFNGKNGWAIGTNQNYKNRDDQDILLIVYLFMKFWNRKLFPCIMPNYMELPMIGLV